MSDEPHLICGRATCEKCIDDAEKIETLEAALDEARGLLAAKDAQVAAWIGRSSELQSQLTAEEATTDALRGLLERLRDHEDHDQYCDGCEYRLKMINAALTLAPPAAPVEGMTKLGTNSAPPAATPPATCRHGEPLFNAAGEIVITTCGCHATMPAAPPPCATCDPDCGHAIGQWNTKADGFATYGDGDVLRVFCTPACRDAGAPRNPEKPCETCSGRRETRQWAGEGPPNNRKYSWWKFLPCPTCTPGAKP